MFNVPAVISKIQTLKDQSFKLTIECQELAKEEMADVFGLNNKSGWLVFSKNELQKSDIPEDNAPEFKNDKSPSQRLRSVLFVYWKEATDKSIDFDTFYKMWIEKRIEAIKDKLP